MLLGEHNQRHACPKPSFSETIVSKLFDLPPTISNSLSVIFHDRISFAAY
ncbi:hypothetical protein [Streptomyces yangpuensis]